MNECTVKPVNAAYTQKVSGASQEKPKFKGCHRGGGSHKNSVRDSELKT